MKSLIIGMGIGELYKSVLTELGHEIYTVDSNPEKNATFTSVEEALLEMRGTKFDTVHICTPNFTHEPIARQVADYARIVFIEKPGVVSEAAWRDLVASYPDTRIMMVRNNMWRDNIDELFDLAFRSAKIELNWINKDRVPNPGTWFTTKKLSYGGVSRDLMPHLLSLYVILAENYKSGTETFRDVRRNWSLEDLTKTDYGTVNQNGTYDVDDHCRIDFHTLGRKWELTADWKTNEESRVNIVFTLPSGKVTKELGLCPESAYLSMIVSALECYDDDEFWKDQLDVDCWIHSKIEGI